MPWPCYMVERVELAEPRQAYTHSPSVTTREAYCLSDGREVLFRELRVGAMWEDPKRGLCVKLPGNETGQKWFMREPATNGSGDWTVTGSPPNVTAYPSIHCIGSYHGWVRDGVVTEDCDGRKFDDFGKHLAV